MIRFLTLLAFAGASVLAASLIGGGMFMGVVLLANLVGGFAVFVTLLNEICRVLT
jgi:hypothetical protein